MNSATSDLLFKLVFSDERNRRALIHLLSSVVGFQVAGVDIRKTEMTPEFVGGKESRLDILATDENGTYYNVEVQKYTDENMPERSLFYWAEVYFKQLKKSETYDLLKKTICINILEENLFKDERFWHTFHMRDDKTFEILSDKEEIHFLEISKAPKFSKESPITWWLEFLKNPHSDAVKEIGEFEPAIKEAVQMFDIVSSDPNTQELLRMREKGERDFNSAVKNAKKSGEAEGRMEGRNEREREMALKMLKKGSSIEDIADITELSVNEIKSLKVH
jgi:predicted transposase/invertase (TIGR01784 family)